jgi:hypothetical protein
MNEQAMNDDDEALKLIDASGRGFAAQKRGILAINSGPLFAC